MWTKKNDSRDIFPLEPKNSGQSVKKKYLSMSLLNEAPNHFNSNYNPVLKNHGTTIYDCIPSIRCIRNTASSR